MKESLKKRISSPYTLEDFHFFATIFWIIMLVPTVMFLRESVLWVSFMSLYAIVVSHATGISAAKGEQELQQVTKEINNGTNNQRDSIADTNYSDATKENNQDS